MSKGNLRLVILVTGLITGLIHAVVLSLIGFDWLMFLNGIGFLILTWAVYAAPPFLARYRAAVHYVFILYTLVTIVGFFVFNDTYGTLGIIAKVDEVILLVALWLHLRS